MMFTMEEMDGLYVLSQFICGMWLRHPCKTAEERDILFNQLVKQ